MANNNDIYIVKAQEAIEYVYQSEYHNSLGIPMPIIQPMKAPPPPPIAAPRLPPTITNNSPMRHPLSSLEDELEGDVRDELFELYDELDFADELLEEELLLVELYDAE